MVGTSIWSSKRFRALPDDLCRLGYVYVLTCSHCNTIGAFRLPPEYMAADLRWSTGEANRVLDNLAKVGLVYRDLDENLVSIANWWEFNGIANRKHLQSALRALDELPIDSNAVAVSLIGVAASVLSRVSTWSQAEAKADAMAMVDAALKVVVQKSPDSMARAMDVVEKDIRNKMLDRFGIRVSIPVSKPVSIPVSPTETETERERETEIERESETEIEKDRDRVDSQTQRNIASLNRAASGSKT